MSLTLIVDSLLSLVMVIYHRVEALNCELCSFLVSFYMETNSKDYYKEVVILLKDNCFFLLYVVVLSCSCLNQQPIRFLKISF